MKETTIVVALALVLVLPSVAGVAVAQETTSTPTPTPTPEPAPENPTRANETKYNTTDNISVQISQDYTVSGLRYQGDRVGGRPSVRRLGNGMIWYRHTPTGILAKDDPGNYSRYIRPYTTVRRDHIYLGGFLGFDAPDETVDVRVVTYNVKRVEYQEEGSNRTFTRQVPVNVTGLTAEKTLAGGKMFRNEISLPGLRGKPKMVAIWIEGHRESTQMAFRVQKSAAYASVPSDTVAGRIKWAGTIIGLPMFLVAAGMLAFDKRLLEKVGAGPMVSSVEYAFVGLATTFLASFVFYDGVINAFAKRPFLIGVLGGVFLGALAIWFFSDEPEEWLFLQPQATEAEMDETGTGSWHWANRALPVVKRDRDDKRVVPREGYLALIARAWPMYDAAPVLEFDAANPEHRTLESPPESVEIPDDAGIWERIRTHFVGSDDEDEYDRIMVVDPTADDVIEHDPETFVFGIPDLLLWPETEDDGVWIHGVPIPHIRIGLIIGGLAFIGLAGVGTTLLTSSTMWGVVAGILATLACVVRPHEGTATAVLAPANFDAVIRNMIQTLEGYSEEAGRQHFKDRFLTTEAKRRIEFADQQEAGQMTMFEQMSDRLAPDPDDNSDVPSTNGKTPHPDAGSQEVSDD